MHWLLFPFTLLYCLIIKFRNHLFEFGVLKSTKFDFPVISVGNITVGGTGKTPHIEFLVRLLKDEFQLATLSRGYKRKTRSFITAKPNSTSDEIGDEPKQLKQKFPNITVAVDRKRVNGVIRLLEQNKNLDVILLDDAFQHRSIKPGLSILLIDYNRPLHKDRMLPVGRLRESPAEIKRAHIIIFTKTPKDIQPVERQIAIKKLKPLRSHSVYFTSLNYGVLKPVVLDTEMSDIVINQNFLQQQYIVILVTGIANPQALFKYLEPYCKSIVKMQFSDHHDFTIRNFKHIEKKVQQIASVKHLIITTEKDAIRIRNFVKKRSISKNILKCFYYIPIEIEFIHQDTNQFENQILEYVRKIRKHS